MRQVPQLPPGYEYVRPGGTRIFISYLTHDDLRYRIPGYWLKDETAASAAWAHYRNKQSV